MPYEKNDLIDYVKYAVRAARSLFDRRVVSSHLTRVRTSMQMGLVPLGAEIELSNVGFAAVEPQRSKVKSFDAKYDVFRYFHDFQMEVLSWKLGGYIDDHSGSTELAGRRGFLELAPGRLSIAGELSRPATADPWMLNHLIREIVLSASFVSVASQTNRQSKAIAAWFCEVFACSGWRFAAEVTRQTVDFANGL
jgi:hypothetical protein